VLWLTAEGFDGVALQHRGLVEDADWDLVGWCLEQERAICTKNRRDFERQHEHVGRRGDLHCGIIISGDWTTPEVYWALRRFLESCDDALLVNELIYLEPAPDWYADAHPVPPPGLT